MYSNWLLTLILSTFPDARGPRLFIVSHQRYRGINVQRRERISHSSLKVSFFPWMKKQQEQPHKKETAHNVKNLNAQIPSINLTCNKCGNNLQNTYKKTFLHAYMPMCHWKKKLQNLTFCFFVFLLFHQKCIQKKYDEFASVTPWVEEKKEKLEAECTTLLLSDDVSTEAFLFTLFTE